MNFTYFFLSPFLSPTPRTTDSPDFAAARTRGKSIRLLLTVAALAIMFAVVTQLSAFAGVRGYLMVMIIGAAVGGIEILARYPYAPMRAAMTPNGALYMLVNIIAAAAAYYLVGAQGFDAFAAVQGNKKHIYEILTAGLGALAFMRSSLFKLQVGNTEIGVGPVAVLDSLLVVADRGVDRDEAVHRAREVTDILQKAGSRIGAPLLSAYCIALMQNVSTEERESMRNEIALTAELTGVPEAIRIDIIVLKLSNLVGPDVLAAAIDALVRRLGADGSPLPGAGEPAPERPASAAAERQTGAAEKSIPPSDELLRELTKDIERPKTSQGKPEARS